MGVPFSLPSAATPMYVFIACDAPKSTMKTWFSNGARPIMKLSGFTSRKSRPQPCTNFIVAN